MNMGVQEVVYSRLFNLPNYQNERIALRYKLEMGQTPEQAIGFLATKVIQIHKVLEYWRRLMSEFAKADREVNDIKEDLRFRFERLASLEAERASLDEKDEKQRCRIFDIEQQIKRLLDEIENVKKELREAVNKRNEILKKLSEVESKIKSGKFDEIELPEPELLDPEKLIEQAKEDAKVDIDLEEEWL